MKRALLHIRTAITVLFAALCLFLVCAETDPQAPESQFILTKALGLAAGLAAYVIAKK